VILSRIFVGSKHNTHGGRPSWEKGSKEASLSGVGGHGASMCGDQGETGHEVCRSLLAITGRMEEKYDEMKERRGEEIMN